MLTPTDGGRSPTNKGRRTELVRPKGRLFSSLQGRTWRWASVMAVGMAVATMGRDDAAAGEECAGSDELPDETWREITVAEGSQGPRSYMFSAQRVRVTRKGKPGEGAWAVYRRNLDGSEPRYDLSNAPEDTMLETLAYVGGSRWRIESEFETEKGDVGLDEYETRSWAGWHHHIAMCLLGGAFLRQKSAMNPT